MKFFKDKETNEIIPVITDNSQYEKEKYIEIKPNTVDAAKEKHVPVYEREGKKIKVKVGETPHPMTEEHYIMWIIQEEEGNITKKELNPTDKPEAEFPYRKGANLYACCNLHSVWKNTVE